MHALMVEKLSKNFGGIQALINVDLSVDIGERRGIIGPNGAGKTTFFHVISGLIQPSRGDIFLFGKNVTMISAHIRTSLGLGRTFQITELFSNLTVLENVLIGVLGVDSARFCLLRSIASHKHLLAKVEDLLNIWGLWEKRDELVRSLSYGEHRQIDLIVALAQKPRLLLLDEPTAGLGPAETEVLCSMIQTFPRDMTLLIIEHDINTAVKLTGKVTVLHTGQVIAEGSWNQIRMDSLVQGTYLGIQQ